MFDIRRAAVIGSGVMGGAIAAHLANAGLQVTLLDIAPNKLTEEEAKKGLTLNDKAVRNRIVMQAQERMKNPKSMLLYAPESLELITFGNLEDDLELLKKADWVVEAVIENLAIKKDLFAKITPYLNEHVILSSNTSGISVNTMSEILPKDLKGRFIITHFFNPPRFMKLLELVPAATTSQEVLEYLTLFCEKQLGKGIVVAKDTPGFIANRIGVQALMSVVHKAKEYNLSIEETDALTGSEIGRPRTGTFRLLDMIGIDTLVNVSNYLHENIDEPVEKGYLQVPEVITKLVEKGAFGDKSKQGFYKKVDKDTLVLEPATMEYRPKKSFEFASLAQAQKTKNFKEKLNILVYADDQAGKFCWEVIKRTLLFSGSLIPTVADNTQDIDNAMKWGYNWELGPFELWDMIGVRKSVEKMQAEGEKIPELVTAMLAAGQESFYGKNTLAGESKKIDAAALKAAGKAVLAGPHASLVDMGDDIACFVLHSPNSSITDEVVQFMHQAVAEVERNYKGMVLASSGKNFCVGANLPYILQNARDKNFKAIDELVKAFQGMMMSMKYCAKPVVSAPFAMTLGGGAELVLHSTQVRPFGETNMGLVEVGVGLVPGGGGTKEMMLRATEAVNEDRTIELAPFIMKAFDNIIKARVSTSATDAKRIGYLRKTDILAMGRDWQLYQAKQDVLQLSDRIEHKNRQKLYRVGGEGLYSTLMYNVYQMLRGGYITEHDQVIAGKIASVLCGGKVGSNALVSEQHLLDLERESFVSLCGEPKTQERIEHMLTKGKALRN